MIKHGDLLEDKLAPWLEKWTLSENEPIELKSFRLKIVTLLIDAMGEGEG